MSTLVPFFHQVDTVVRQYFSDLVASGAFSLEHGAGPRALEKAAKLGDAEGVDIICDAYPGSAPPPAVAAAALDAAAAGRRADLLGGDDSNAARQRDAGERHELRPAGHRRSCASQSSGPHPADAGASNCALLSKHERTCDFSC